MTWLLGDGAAVQAGGETMSNTTYIGPHPPDAPPIGHEWECCCARCGSSMDHERCDVCEDGFSDHDCGEDCCCCLDPEPNVPCDWCGGEGGWWRCLSSAEWCEANPRKGREGVRRSTPEWFLVERE